MNLSAAVALGWLLTGLVSGALDGCGMHAVQLARDDSRIRPADMWYVDERGVAPELIRRGRALRHALASQTDAGAPMRADGVDMQRGVVLQYIPPGMPFADAEAVLRAAGMDVYDRGPLPAQGPDAVGVRANLNFRMALAQEDIEVSLLPGDRTDWRQVREVHTRRRFTAF